MLWDEIKTHLTEGINWAFYTKISSISQKQAVIKHIEKKDGTLKNDTLKTGGQFFSHVATKILSKAIWNKLKAVLPTLIYS